MAKAQVARCRKKKGKEDSVNTEGQAETVSSSEQMKEAPVESTEMKPEEENQDEQDSQMDIEVKGSKPTVTVSWDQKSEEEKENIGEDIPCESTETNVNQEIRESAESEEVTGEHESTPTETVTSEEKNGEGESKDIQKKTKRENGKRKATSTDETSPSKKTKLINDGYCLYVGNLDQSKTSQDVRESLASYFMTQSLLVQNIRLDPSRKHAYIDLASEMDLTKGLTLNGNMLLDKPMKIAKAKIKSEVKVKASAAERRAPAVVPPNNTLFVSNLSFNVKESNLNNVFKTAVGIKMPQNQGKSKGYAFVEFANVEDAEKALQASQKLQICKRTVKIQFYEKRGKTESVTVLSDTLSVRGLAEKTTAETLKTAFEGSLRARVCTDKETGLSKGFGFVEFGNAKNCKAVKEAMQDCEIDGRKVTVDYARPKVEKGNQGPKGGPVKHPAGQPAGQQAARDGVKDKGAKGAKGGGKGGRGTGKPKKLKG